MKKNKFLIAALLLLGLGLTIKTVPIHADELEVGYFINRKSQEVTGDAFVQVETHSPWEAGPKIEITVDQVAVNKEYIAIDMEVTRSIGNPEGVFKIGVNGNAFLGPDDLLIPGNPTGVEKKWGNWLFFPEIRTTLFFKVSDFLPGVAEINKVGIYFDTVPNRSVKLNIYGFYQVDGVTDELADNYFDFDNLALVNGSDVINDPSVIQVGVTASRFEEVGTKWLFDAVELTDTLEGGLKIHVKSVSEGGETIAMPDDFGFITVDLSDQNINVTNDDGLAIQVYASDGLTFFLIFLEDEAGNVYRPHISGGDESNPTRFKFASEGIASTSKGFYGAFNLEGADIGTLYVPYDSFEQIDYFQGDILTADASVRINKISKIHIGLDMLYGLGRYLIVGNFASISVENNEIDVIADFKNYDDNQMDLGDLTKGSIVYNSDPSEVHRSNFVVAKVLDVDLPNYVQPIDLTELQATIAVVQALTESEYTAASWANLSNKLSFAVNIAEHSELYTQVDINSAESNLRAALEALELYVAPPIEPIDTTVVWVGIGSGLGGLIIGAGATLLVLLFKKKRLV